MSSQKVLNHALTNEVIDLTPNQSIREVWEKYFKLEEISFQSFVSQSLQLSSSVKLVSEFHHNFQPETVLHCCQQFLFCISVEYGSNVFEAGDFLLRSKLKPNGPRDFTTNLINIFVENGSKSSKIENILEDTGHSEVMATIHSNRFKLLSAIHLLSLLCHSTKHQETITVHYGTNFYLLVIETIRSFISRLEDQVILWSDFNWTPGAAVDDLRSDGAFIVSALTGLVQICGHVCSPQGFSAGSFAVGSLPPTPWRPEQFAAVGVDLFLGYSDKQAVLSPGLHDSSEKGRRNAASSKGSPMSGHSPSSSSSTNKSDKSGEKIFPESVQVLVVLLRKLFYFSKAVSQFEDAVAIYEIKRTSSCRLDGNNMVRMVVALQCEVIFSVSCSLASRPATYAQFRICDGPSIVQAHLTLSDVRGLATSSDPVDAELMMQRSLLVMQCHEVCLGAGFKAPKLEFKEAIGDAQQMVSALGPLLKWLVVDQLGREMTGHTFTKELSAQGISALASRFSVECMCPGQLSSPLPPTDLYPWDTDTAFNENSTAKNQFLNCAALSNVFSAHWDHRGDYSVDAELSSEAGASSGAAAKHKRLMLKVFDPNKSVIFALLQSPRISSPLHAYDSPSPSEAELELTPFLSFKATQMVSHLLSTLYRMSWLFVDNNFHPSDSLVLIREALKLGVKTLHHVKDCEGGSAFQILFMLFFARCVKKSPQYTILSCRAESIWRNLFKVAKMFGPEERGAAKLGKNRMYKVNRLPADKPKQTNAEPDSSSTDDVDAYRVSWSASNALRTHRPVAESKAAIDEQEVKIKHTSSNSLDSLSEQSTGDQARYDLNGPSVDEDEATRDRLRGTVELFLPIFLRAAVKDMTLEMLWIYSSCNYLLLTANQTAVSSNRGGGDGKQVQMYSATNDIEAVDLLESLSGTSADDSVLLAVRWFSNLVDLHRHFHMRSSLWPLVVKKALSLCKYHLDSMNSTAIANANTASPDNNIHQRPLFWPARAAVIQLVDKIMHTNVCTNWLDVFVPTASNLSSPPAAMQSGSGNATASRSGAAQTDSFGSNNLVLANPLPSLVSKAAASGAGLASPAPVVDESYFLGLGSVAHQPVNISSASVAGSSAVSQTKQIRHVVVLRLIMDPLCRDLALSIVMKVLFEVAVKLSLDNSFEETVNSSTSPDPPQPLKPPVIVSVYEALAHDILKGLLNTIKNAPQQPEYNDGFGAVLLTLRALTVFLRNPAVLFEGAFESDPLRSALSCASFQRVFARYGIFSSQHALFGWKRGRVVVFADLVSSLDAAFSKAAGKWTKEHKAMIVRHALAFVTALLIGNESVKESFRQYAMQRRKPKSSTPLHLSLSSSLSAFGFSSQQIGSGLSSGYNYHDIILVILAMCEHDSTVSQDTVLILMEMLLDGFSPHFRHDSLMELAGGKALPEEGLFAGDQQDIPKIENLVVLPLLLNLLYYCDEAVQFCILNTIHNLIGGSGSGSLINLSKCIAMQPPVLEMMLDVFPTLSSRVQMKSVKLLQSIGKRTITVAQLKRIFRLMQVRDNYRPVYTWNLLDALEGMILDAEVPKNFLFFQGKNSGLRLPSFRRWPAHSGYSFSTWFCIDSQSSTHHPHLKGGEFSRDSSASAGRSDSSTDRRYNPRLLCFRQENGLGIELLFRPCEADCKSFVLVVGVFSSSKSAAPVFTEIGVVQQIKTQGLGWHHLAFTHTPSGFRAKSEMMVLLDGQLSKHAVSFPRFSDEVRQPTIGDVSPAFKDSHVNTTFFGQLSALYFFSEAVSEVYLHGIHSLGPSYSQLFSDRDGVYRNNGSHQSSVKSNSKALDGTLTPLIMLTFNPGVRKGNYFLDNSPEQNSNKWRSVGFGGERFSDSSSPSDIIVGDEPKNMNARRLAGTYICTTLDMRDSLDCLGGVKVLLPLFTQLTLPVQNSFLFGCSEEESQLEQRALYVKILKVFFALLRGTPENYRLVSESGFTLLAYFMDSLTPRHITMEILDALLGHCDDLADNVEWQNDFYLHVLCNFKLWIFTPYEVQRKLMNFLLSFAGSNVNRAHKVLQVRRLFDSLYFLYSSHAIQRMNYPIASKTKSAADEAFLPRAWASFYSLRPEELSDIRSSILQMVYIIVSATSASIEEELGYLMSYVAHETLPVYKVEALQLLLRLVNPERVELGNKILNCFVARKSIFKILHLHSHPRAKVRLYAVICMCSIVQLGLSLGKLPPPPVFHEKATPASPTGLHRSASNSNMDSLYTSRDTDSVAGGLLSPGAVSNMSGFTAHSTLNSRRSEFDGRDVLESGETGTVRSTDIFEMLGMPVGSLTSYFLWMQEQLRSEMLTGRFETDSVDRQCYVIFTAMQLTMHGHSCKYLVNDVEHILSNKQIASDGADQSAGSQRTSNLSEGDRLSDSPVPPSPGRKSTRDRVTMDDEVEINFEFSRICLPMIIPALFEFVKHVDNVRRRIQLILRLKNSMNGFENMDTVLSIPGWQSSIFHVLSMEQSRLYQLETEVTENTSTRLRAGSQMRELVDIRNVCDILLNMVSDLHIHAVRFGAPSLSFFTVVRANEVSDIQYHKITTRELLELMKKDNRKVGSTIIRETISCLRSYATQGELDAQITGLEMLQSTVDALHRENDTISNSILDPMELNIRRKMLELNLWLITAFILEFVTLPPTQPARIVARPSTPGGGSEFNSGSLKVPSHPKMRRASAAVDDLDALSLVLPGITKARGRSEDVTTNTVSSTDNTLSTDSLNSLDQGATFPLEKLARRVERNQSHRRRSLGSARLDTDSVAGDGISAGVAYESQPQDSRDSPTGENSHRNLHADKIWRLVESLLNLLGPMENFSNSWFASDLVDRLRAGMKVGIRLGRSVVNQIQESVDLMISTHQPLVSGGCGGGPTLKGANNSNSKNASGGKMSTKDSPLSRAIDGVFWVILRVLLNIFVQGASSEQPLDENSSPLKAAVRLSEFMEWVKEGSREYYDLESLYIVTKVTEALRSSRQPPTAPWTKVALSLVSSKLVAQRANIMNRLTAMAAKSEAVVSPGSQKRQEFFSYLQKQPASMVPPSPTGGDAPRHSVDFSEERIASRASFVLPLKEAIQDQIEAMCCSAADSSMTTSNITLEAIRLALELPNDRKFTWQLWSTGMEPILKEAQKSEELMLASKLTDMGLHKHSQEMTVILEKQKHAEATYIAGISLKVEEAINKVHSTENKHLRETGRNEDLNKKKHAQNWNRILLELANERGPWGTGADEFIDALWTVDPCEDNFRMKPKLCKNAHGTQYLRDFLLANAAVANDGSNSSRSSLQGPVTPVAAEDVLSLERAVSRSLEEDLNSAGSGSNPNSGDLNIWKDLLKYQGDGKKRAAEDDSDDEKIQESIENDSMPDVAPANSSNSSSSAQNFEGTLNADNEKILFHANCEVIVASSNSTNVPSFGHLEITKNKITFTRAGEANSHLSASSQGRSKRQESVACESLWACQPFPSTTWNSVEICNIHQRYYQLRFVAVEIFTTSRKVIFFNLFEQKVANLCQMVMRRDVRPPYMAPFIGKRPTTIVQRSTIHGSMQNLSVAWANREISNFDYLMRLNSIAGRTYNDIGQYPVFPWVLSDYSSPVLDLRNQNSFRDLRWPMGAQDPKQRQAVQSKYADLKSMYTFDSEDQNGNDGASMPPFHYGTHYSVAGFVLWFLMRLEPYTSLHVQLQDGRIDRPDRLFDSLEAAWRGCTSNPSDVKELIPEMFYCPEILRNVNGVDFGVTQTNKKIGDIKLPTWAKDPYDFIYKHREALESEHVSLNLHHWIDLIFGFKQRPPHLPGGDEAAVDACNVFFHLTYENAVDLETLRTTNPALYQQYVCQITEFGQTPCQLFTKPHIQRLPLSQVDIIWPIASIVRGIHTLPNIEDMPVQPRKVICFKEFRVSVWPIVLIAETADRLVTVDATRILGCHNWQILSPDVVPPFKIKIDQSAYETSKGQVSMTSLLRMPNYSSSTSGKEKRIGVPFAPAQALLSSSSGSASLSSSRAGVEGASVWRPVKIKNYEKDEKIQLKRGGGKLGGGTLSVPVTPTSSAKLSGKKSQQLAPEVRHDKMNLIGLFDQQDPSSRPNNRIRSQSEAIGSVGESAGGSSSSRRQVTDTQKSALKNSSGVMDSHLSSRLFAFMPENKLLFSCGHWDHSLRATSSETGRLVQSVCQHSDVITCLAIGKDFGQTWLVTGSRDCTLMIWEVHADRDVPLGEHPLHILYGHDDAVTSVAINPEIDVVVSGSEDGTVIIHNLRDGTYVRSIIDGIKGTSLVRSLQTDSADSRDHSRSGTIDETYPEYFSASSSNSANNTPTLSRTNSSAVMNAGAASNQATAPPQQTRKVTWLGLSKENYIVTYSSEDLLLCTYTLNGFQVATHVVPESLYSFLISEDGKVLITGGSSCLVVFRWIHNLELANDGPRLGLEAALDGSMEDTAIPPFASPIRALHLTRMERHLVVGLESGEMRILAQDSDYLRQRLQRKLIEIGIL